MRRVAVASGLLLLAASLPAQAAAKPWRLARNGPVWITANVSLKQGQTLRLASRISHRRPVADGCYVIFHDQLQAKWERPLGGSGAMTCSRTWRGPLRTRLTILLASAGQATTTVSLLGASRIRWGWDVRLWTLDDFTGPLPDAHRTKSRVFRRSATALFSTGPAGRGAALLSQAGPTPMTSWIVAGRSWTFADASIIGGKPGSYNFAVEAAPAKQWVTLVSADAG